MAQTFCSTFSAAFLGVIVLLSVAAATPAQSLGEVARQYQKERQGRAKNGEKPAKVFTNDDIATRPPAEVLNSSTEASSLPAARRSGPPRSPGATAVGTQSPASAVPSVESESRQRPKAYWQARFKAARAVLARAKDEETLAKEELSLLEIQQARELDPGRSRKLNSQVGAATVELETKHAATEKAQRSLEHLEKEFKDSGAPQDWIQQESVLEQ